MMAITYVIDDEVQTGLRKKSVFVQVKNSDPTTAYRRAEVIMPLGEDAATYIPANYTDSELWAMGEAAAEGDFMAAQERPLVVPVYKPIIRKLFDALAGPADLDTIRAQLITYVQQNEDVYAKLNAALDKLGVDASTPEMKREQLMWVVLFALAAAWNAQAESA